jgi:hypothetical protein
MTSISLTISLDSKFFSGLEDIFKEYEDSGYSPLTLMLLE